MTRQSLVLPLLAILAAMACFQMGAAAAKQLYPAIGPIGAATVRLVLGAAILLALVRPWRNWPANPPLLALLGLGASMAATLLCFYLAIERLPLGVALSLQIMGPLLLAGFESRRRLDFLWVLLAAFGVFCLVGLEPVDRQINALGVLYAVIAAAGWAGYIVFGRAAGTSFGPATAALSVSVAALLVLPIGLAKVGMAMFDPALLPWALLVALLSASIPFSLELYAMPLLPARTFAISMSLEPAFAVLSGLIFLGEHLVIGASAGSVRSSAESH